MTKSEFDDAFLCGDVCILHKNKVEWAEICSYAATLGVRPQTLLPNDEHDCDLFPYAYVNQGAFRMSARTKGDSFSNVLSFAEFLEAVSNDTVVYNIPDLNDIL